MKTIFCLFDSYEDARAAVDRLLDRGIDEENMNAIVLANVARSNVEVDLERVNVQATDEVGDEEVRGLDRLLATQEPAKVPDVGRVVAAGDLATTLLPTARTTDTSMGGFEGALIDFSVPEDRARCYAAGVRDGKLLFFVRTDEENARIATNVLSDFEGDYYAV